MEREQATEEAVSDRFNKHRSLRAKEKKKQPKSTNISIYYMGKGAADSDTQNKLRKHTYSASQFQLAGAEPMRACVNCTQIDIYVDFHNK